LDEERERESSEDSGDNEPMSSAQARREDEMRLDKRMERLQHKAWQQDAEEVSESESNDEDEGRLDEDQREQTAESLREEAEQFMQGAMGNPKYPKPIEKKSRQQYVEDEGFSQAKKACTHICPPPCAGCLQSYERIAGKHFDEQDRLEQTRETSARKDELISGLAEQLGALCGLGKEEMFLKR